MNAKEYVKNVLTTENKDFASIAARISTTQNIRLIHALAGIDSEISEVIAIMNKYDDNYHSWQDFQPIDRVNLMEEISDIFWYISIAADSLDAVDEILEPLDFYGGIMEDDHDLYDATSSFVTRSSNNTGLLFDMVVKKYIFYGKPMDKDSVEQNLRYIFISASLSLNNAGYTVEQARERNIAKLKARYGDKFTEAAALERNLELERTILENK